MKKLAIAATGALALAGIGVGVSSAVTPTTTITAKVTPLAHGNRKTPKKAKLVINLTTTPKPGEPAFAADTTVVHLAKELAFGGKFLPTCPQQQVQTDDTKCPKGSKVGQGSAQGTALGLIEKLKVTAYNGPGGSKLELLVQAVDSQQPLPIHSVIEGVLSKDTGLYGNKLTVQIPQDLQTPAPNTYATLTQFNTTINAISGKKKMPYVGIVSCPKTKKMAFAVDYHYKPDNSVGHADTTAPCK